MNELTDKMGYIHTIEYYCLKKKGKTSTREIKFENT